MFSGNWSLNVLKAKFICVWERRGETEQSSGLGPTLSRAYRYLGMSVKIYRQKMEAWQGAYAGTQPRQVRVEWGWVPSHSSMALYVFMCFMDVSGEQLPHQMTPNKRGSKCCCLMSCRLVSISLGGRYFPTEPFTRLGRGYNGWQTRDQSSLLLDSSTRDLTTIFHSADEL